MNPVTIPRDPGNNPDYGLIIVPRKKKPFFAYYAMIRISGRLRRVNLKCSTVEEARFQRDRLYKNLKKTKQAAIAAPVGRPKVCGEWRFVKTQPSYVVKIGSRKVGTAETLKKAGEIRDAYLKEHPEADRINRKPGDLRKVPALTVTKNGVLVQKNQLKRKKP